MADMGRYDFFMFTICLKYDWLMATNSEVRHIVMYYKHYKQTLLKIDGKIK